MEGISESLKVFEEVGWKERFKDAQKWLIKRSRDEKTAREKRNEWMKGWINRWMDG